jgi:hypothetical protein
MSKKQQSRISLMLTTLLVLTLIMIAGSPAFSQGNSFDAQDGTAGGRADVPGKKGPGLDRSHAVNEGDAVRQMAPDSDHRRTIPIGRTEQGRAAKDRANRGQVEPTTKPVGKLRATSEDRSKPDESR